MRLLQELCRTKVAAQWSHGETSCAVLAVDMVVQIQEEVWNNWVEAIFLLNVMILFVKWP